LWGRQRKTPATVVIEYLNATHDKNIILCIDIFYIGGLTILLSVSRYLNMYMVTHLQNRTMSTLKKAMGNQISISNSQKYVIKYLLVDNESAVTACIPYLNELGITVNQTPKNEHIPEVERAGRTLKERVRAKWNTLPYTLNNDMIVGLTYYACKMINMFPKANSASVAPRELFTGVRIDYKRDKLGFGEYVQVYAENDITNTMQPRTFGALIMRSAGNMQGTYLFMSLLTWKVIRRRAWVEMPLPKEVIDLINRNALSNTVITSDCEVKLGNNIIDDGLTSEDIELAEGTMMEHLNDDDRPSPIHRDE
jgi:hypothetical protein